MLRKPVGAGTPPPKDSSVVLKVASHVIMTWSLWLTVKYSTFLCTPW